MPVKRSPDEVDENPVFAKLRAGVQGATAPVVEAPPVIEPAANDERSTPEPVAPKRKPTPKKKAAKTKAKAKSSPVASDKPKMKTVFFSRDEIAGNDAVLDVIKASLGCKVPESVVTRVLWQILRESEAELSDMASTAPQLERPSTGDEEALAKFEASIAEHLGLAIKRWGRKS